MLELRFLLFAHLGLWVELLELVDFFTSLGAEVVKSWSGCLDVKFEWFCM